MSEVKKVKKSFFQKFLDSVEKIGNKLPNPLTLFVILSFAIVILSYFLNKMGISVSYDVTNKTDAGVIETVKKDAAIVSLMNAEGIRYIFSSMVENFKNYPPLEQHLFLC